MGMTIAMGPWLWLRDYGSISITIELCGYNSVAIALWLCPYVSTAIIWLYYPIAGATNPKYKLLHFLTTVFFDKEKKALAF
jgi:hypothetical protein